MEKEERERRQLATVTSPSWESHSRAIERCPFDPTTTGMPCAISLKAFCPQSDFFLPLKPRGHDGGQFQGDATFLGPQKLLSWLAARLLSPQPFHFSYRLNVSKNSLFASHHSVHILYSFFPYPLPCLFKQSLLGLGTLSEQQRTAPCAHTIGFESQLTLQQPLSLDCHKYQHIISANRYQWVPRPPF